MVTINLLQIVLTSYTDHLTPPVALIGPSLLFGYALKGEAPMLKITAAHLLPNANGAGSVALPLNA
ncbi:hypothetical protein GCM10025789_08970 [Tessaracoccus lubricantis]|uniref:Uncharacterized protein n=1 Tax=Tessaracoccus lubricantis TaxID=545543 RepID=A0ABP9F4P4_9ACTN